MNINIHSGFPTHLRAVLFDLDGTLVDTADEFVPVVQTLRAEHGLAPMNPENIRNNVSNGARALVKLGLGIEENAAEFETKRLRLLELYSEMLGTLAKPYAGIVPLLERLHQNNIAWGIATNKPRPYTEPLLDALNIQPAPGSVVCPEDVTDRKPHPESLYLNCKELGCAPHEAIYIGDHVRDIQAGKRAGMFTVAAAYGYIETSDDASAWGANLCANQSEHLEAIIFGD